MFEEYICKFILGRFESNTYMYFREHKNIGEPNYHKLFKMSPAFQ